MPVDKFGRMSDTKTKDTGVSLTYINNNYVRSDGGTPLSGSLDMKGNSIYNVADPVNPQDVVTKEYVDRGVGGKHLIAVHARYCGPLKEGEYPFKFGGNSLEICEEVIKKDNRLKGLISGFVMPHPGRIKKIICESLTYINLYKLVNELINSFNEDQINKLKKHFGKEDFKKDLLKKIRSTADFTNRSNEGKTFFKIVKFKKIFLGEEERSFLETISFIPTLIRLIDSVLIEKFKWKEFELLRLDEIRAIMKNLNHDNIPLEEGDTINIEISDFQKDLFSEGDLLENILKTTVLRLFGSLNFNFTFLIELDPL